MTHPELTAKLAHEKWVKERRPIADKRIKSSTLEAWIIYNHCMYPLRFSEIKRYQLI